MLLAALALSMPVHGGAETPQPLLEYEATDIPLLQADAGGRYGGLAVMKASGNLLLFSITDNRAHARLFDQSGRPLGRQVIPPGLILAWPKIGIVDGAFFVSIDRGGDILLCDGKAVVERYAAPKAFPFGCADKRGNDGSLLMTAYVPEEHIALYRLGRKGYKELWSIPLSTLNFGDITVLNEEDGSALIVGREGEIAYVEGDGSLRFHLKPEDYISSMFSPEWYERFEEYVSSGGFPLSVWDLQRVTKRYFVMTLNTGTILKLDTESGTVTRLSSHVYGSPPSVRLGDPRIAYLAKSCEPGEETEHNDVPHEIVIQDIESGAVLSHTKGYGLQDKLFLLASDPALATEADPVSDMQIAVDEFWNGVSVIQGKSKLHIWKEPEEYLRAHGTVLDGRLYMHYPDDEHLLIIRPKTP